MKFSFYTYLETMLIEKGPEYTGEYALKMGFSGLELVNMSSKNAIPDIAAARKVRKVMDGYDLPFVCYSVPCNVLRNGAIEEMYKKVDIAKELGSPYVHHTLICTPPCGNFVYDEGVLFKLVHATEKIADYADTLGITCIYEQQGLYVNGTKNYSEFYDEMKKRCANVGICADFGNSMFVGEQPTEIIRKYAGDIKQVHFKDYLSKETSINPGMHWMRISDDKWLRDTMIGHGIIEYEKCLKIIKDSGYDGYFSLELGHPEPFDDGVKQAMEYTERIMNLI